MDCPNCKGIDFKYHIIQEDILIFKKTCLDCACITNFDYELMQELYKQEDENIYIHTEKKKRGELT